MGAKYVPFWRVPEKQPSRLLAVLPRTDGKFIVYHPELPMARRTLSVHSSPEEALDAAEKWLEVGG
jgi:predicted RNase H-like HicB family nuclease